jgi:hypothetical protein
MIVGCPAYKRAWILPQWYENVIIAAREASVHDLAFVFVLNKNDEETITCIEQLIKLPTKLVIVEQKFAKDDHLWNFNRFNEMVMLRNELLKTVRAIDPDLFLSIDSDILLHPKSIKNMVESLERFDTVGGKCYMQDRGTFSPSYAMLGQTDNLVRPDTDGVIPVDCIMAIKLMTKPAWWVEYSYHDKGEDIAWSKNCRERGLKLGWDGRNCSKHVMTKEMLDPVDERCGF